MPPPSASEIRKDSGASVPTLVSHPACSDDFCGGRKWWRHSPSSAQPVLRTSDADVPPAAQCLEQTGGRRVTVKLRLPEAVFAVEQGRSEERRGGRECVSRCGIGWST